ncbi:3-hydroxyisobutyrate dehydrogenase [Agrobacterium fabacearum S56]|uniref:NAD(P)-dependent oxidoreductase n=1 Tax=Agrobacterium tumefaciens TaxID=358 RepID=UPI0009BB6830|nr:NAD(P)-dependent oxidoreductase [Agrobacterium tumefaciens]CUX07042.1 3-hydroxyisobutyrate dehydrogenase [Agrobacterium fabacearum S56]
MTTVAFIGVGRMGSRMALRLLDAGHVVHVYDPNTTATSALAEKGAIVATSPSDAAAPSMFVLSSLPSPATLRDAILGETGILRTVAAGTTVIDFSTVDAATTKSVAAQCQAKGVHFMDAPVSGGVAGAGAGTLLVMAGASQEVLDAARPVLGPIAARIVHCGPVGSGQLTKLAHNLLTAINTVALGEVLAASVKSGANLSVLTEVLSGGLAGSKMLDYLSKTLFTEERPANFALDLMHKDISLCLEEFSAYPMPLGQAVRQIYNMARAEGLGGKDSTSVAEVFENFLKIDLRLPANA